MRWIAVVLVLCLLMTGCSMTQMRQGFTGYTANDVKDAKNKQVITVDISGPDCIKKIKDILTFMKAIVREDAKSHYIYADNLQKAFRSTVDTTQVGILVTWLEPDKCRIETASENNDLAVFVSKELEKKLKSTAAPAAEVQEEKK